MDLEGDRVAIADVEVGRTTNHHNKGEDIFRAEINLEYNGQNFRSESKKHDIRVAIDDCCNDLGRRVKKGRSKKISLFRKGGSKIKDMLKGFKK